MERRCISARHVEKGDGDTLLILSMDNTSLPRDLEDILAHNLKDVGLWQFARMVIERLKRPVARDTDFGTIRHPEGTVLFRSPLRPCSFHVNEAYERDPLDRWQKLADVLVDLPECHNSLKTEYVYLIPSGGVSPFLRHSQLLRTDPTLLQRKREATVRFIKKLERENCQDIGLLCAKAK